MAISLEHDFGYGDVQVNDMAANIEEMRENVGALLDIVDSNKKTLQLMGDILNKQLQIQEKTVVLLQAISDKLD